MYTERIQMGPDDRLQVSQVNGDLRLAPSDDKQLQVRIGDAAALSLKRATAGVELETRAGCLLFVPQGCAISIGKVGGDLRAFDLAADLHVETVAGGLNVRQGGAVDVGRVAGDLVARRLRGRLHVASVAGDAQLEDLQADAELNDVGGDLRLRHATGSLTLRVGGDVRLELAPAQGTHSVVRAGGDLHCSLPPEASAWIEAQAGGDLRLPKAAERGSEGGQDRYRLGSGAADLRLEAGGDLRVRQMDDRERREDIDLFVDEINTTVRSQVESALAEAASSLKSLDGLPNGAAIARQVEESLRAAGVASSMPRPATGGRSRSAGRSSGPGDNPEQMAILDMLQAGKINSKEAEMLLNALEEGG